jgi:BMFP domain-containing protein YqiC
MRMKKTTGKDVLAMKTVMQRDLKPLTEPMTPEELQQRADMVERLIRARRKLELLRNRKEALEDALNRFKTRQEAIRA